LSILSDVSIRRPHPLQDAENVSGLDIAAIKTPNQQSHQAWRLERCP
jgi:hypothetical protein